MRHCRPLPGSGNKIKEAGCNSNVKSAEPAQMRKPIRMRSVLPLKNYAGSKTYIRAVCLHAIAVRVLCTARTEIAVNENGQL